jgi:hypothetical protein
MTASTPRFALTTLNKGDGLSADDYAFGRGNRLQLDRLLLQVIENHHHTGILAPNTPGPATSTKVTPTGGVFPANHAIFYKTALVDPRGQEYVASQPAIVITPPTLPAPEPPVLTQARGGVLLPGDYIYQLSVYTEDTSYETTLSRPTTSTLAEANQWTIALPALPAGATGWNIYRKGPTDLEPMFLASTTNSGPWLDNGTGKPQPYRTAPTANTTSSMNAVIVGIDGETVPSGYTLKIYRTLDQGDWSSSLVTRVATLPYTDTGHATQSGVPLARSAALGGAPKIRFFENTIGTLPPSSYTTPRIATFTLAGPVTAGLSPWQWVCEYDEAVIVSLRATLGRGFWPAAYPVKATVRLRREGEADWVPLLTTSWDPPREISATVEVGSSIGNRVNIASSDLNTRLYRGDALRAVVLQAGGGATPTDSDLSLMVTMLAHNGTATTTHVWKDD